MKEPHKKKYIFFKTILKLPFILWYNPKIIGKNNIPQKGSLIVCANHKHIMDQCPILISTKRMVHYMAKKEYFDGKFAWFFKLAGCIPVDRSIHDDKAKAAALEVLELDGAVGLFPEGTRNKTDDLLLLPFKFGTVSMAQKTGATIVPCALTGDYTFRSKNLMFRVGKPFKVDKKDDLAEANDKLYKEMERLMKKNFEESGRTLEEELASRCQDTKKKAK
jgi:1-acyl-sn-glycerol-3-phosphate acyltransferase